MKKRKLLIARIREKISIFIADALQNLTIWDTAIKGSKAKPRMTFDAIKVLREFYVKTREKQGRKAKNVMRVDYELMNVKDLIKIKNQAIKIAKERKANKVLIKDVKKAIKIYEDNYMFDLLLSNSHIRKSLIKIAKGKGEVGKFALKIRNQEVGLKEVSNWLRKDFKKTLEAFEKDKRFKVIKLKKK